MCGIVSVIRFDGYSGCRMVRRRYEDQKTRGQSGYGYVAVKKDGGTIKVARAQYEKEIMAELEQEKDATMILFHHRMPTSSPNYVEQTHPIKVSSDYFEFDYYVAHNGVIYNDDELKKAHDILGIPYSTEMAVCHKSQETKNEYVNNFIWNDSEALAVELALVIEGKVKEMTARGSIAFVLYQVHRETQVIRAVYYGRNTSNPLKIESTNSFRIISSEGKGDFVQPDILFRYDPLLGTVTEQKMEFGGYKSYASNHDVSYGYRPYDRDDLDNPKLPTPRGNQLDWGDDPSDSEIDKAIRDNEDAWDMESRLCILYDKHEEAKTNLASATSKNNEEEITKIQAEIFTIETEIGKIDDIIDDHEFKVYNIS